MCATRKFASRARWRFNSPEITCRATQRPDQTNGSFSRSSPETSRPVSAESRREALCCLVVGDPLLPRRRCHGAACLFGKAGPGPRNLPALAPRPPPKTPPMTPAIRVEGLTKRYRETLAVDDISFTLPRGETLGLLGGNGAGKTTTIAMLLGLIVPTAGRITVLGHDMARDRFAALAQMNFSSPYVALPARLSVAREPAGVCVSVWGAAAGGADCGAGGPARPAWPAGPAGGKLSAGRRRGWRWRSR